MRVLHGPVNVGNQPWVLSRYERKLGVHSDLVVRMNSWLKYPVDRYLFDADAPAWVKGLKTASFCMTAPFQYDVLHYYFGQSYLNVSLAAKLHLNEFADLRWARKCGRKVFMTLQGCDVRIAAETAKRNRFAPCRVGQCAEAPSCYASVDDRRRWLVREILPVCHRVFVLVPELVWDAPHATFLPYASVDLESFGYYPPKTDGRITVLHAPSDEKIKGTAVITAALEKLKKRWPIDVVLVRGLPYAQALPLYQSADLVIDQILLSWYGGFAVEAMAMGKPVGCYIREEDLEHIPDVMRDEVPLMRLDPDRLEDQLEDVLRRRREWPMWGRRCRDYVWRWHNPATIAGAMVAAYRHPQAHFDLTAAVGRARRLAA